MSSTQQVGAAILHAMTERLTVIMRGSRLPGLGLTCDPHPARNRSIRIPVSHQFFSRIHGAAELSGLFPAVRHSPENTRLAGFQFRRNPDIRTVVVPVEILLFHQTHVVELFAIGDLARPAYPHLWRDRAVDGLPQAQALRLRTVNGKSPPGPASQFCVMQGLCSPLTAPWRVAAAKSYRAARLRHATIFVSSARSSWDQLSSRVS